MNIPTEPPAARLEPLATGLEVCGARAEDCRCALPPSHLPFEPHSCGVPGCRASWVGDIRDSTFQPVTMPTWPLLPPVPRRLYLVPS